MDKSAAGRYTHCMMFRLVCRFFLYPVLLVNGLVHAAETNIAYANLPLLSGDWTVRSWTVSDGLPESAVRGISFDSKGFLWLVTPRYLCRFDGVRFETVTPMVLPGAPDKPHIKGLEIDRSGRFWLYGTAGVWVGEAGGWHCMLPAGMLPEDQDVRQVAEGRDGGIWLVTPRALWFCQNGKNRQYPLPPAWPPSTQLYSMALDASGSVWLAASDGILKFQAGEFTQVPLPDITPGFPPSIYHIGYGKLSGRIWTSTSLNVLYHQNGQWHVPPVRNRSALFMLPGVFLERAEDDLWIASVYGLYRYSGGVWSRLFAEEGTISLDCRAIAKDPQNNIWIGADSGLIRLSPRLVRAVPFTRRMRGKRVLAVHAKGTNDIFAGCLDAGAVRGGVQGLGVLQELKGLEHSVSAIFSDSAGALWLGTRGQGLWRFKDGKCTAIACWGGTTSQAKGQIIQAIGGQGSNFLWVGSNDGMMSLANAASNGTLKVAFGPEAAVTTLYEDCDGSLWCGYQDEGLIHRLTNGTVQVFREADGLPGPGVFAICRDGEDVLWLGGRGGLACWRGGRRTVLGGRGGLPDSPVVQIVPDEKGYLWIGSRTGICRVLRKELIAVADGVADRLSVRNFGEDEGMSAVECTGGFSFAGWRAPGARLWFGTAAGLVTIDPADVPDAGPAPEPLIESVSVGGVPKWRRPLLAGGLPPVMPGGEAGGCVVELPPGARQVEVVFTALDFSAPGRLRFSCRIGGGAAAWSGLSSERRVRFEWLPPGRHVFEVIACSAGGAWSKSAAGLVLVVRPFFWQTRAFAAWALIVTGVLVGALVRAWQRRQFMARLKELQRQQELQEERERIARDIHDEVGSGLTHVALMSELAQNSVAPNEEVHARLSRIYDAASTLTRSIDEIVWAVNPANDKTEKCLDDMAQYADEFLRTAGIPVTVQLPVGAAPAAIAPAVRHHLFLAFKEVLANVVKHAAASFVRIRFEVDGGRLNVEVKDDGCGFDVAAAPGAESGHDGLGNMKKRMDKAGGTVTIESAAGRGTTVNLQVRVKVTHDNQGRLDRG